MEELMKEEKEGVKAAEQEKPKKRRNRKKNRKNEMRKSYFAGMISMLAIVMIVLVGTTFLWPGSSADRLLVVAEDGGDQSDDQPALRGRCG